MWLWKWWFYIFSGFCSKPRAAKTILPQSFNTDLQAPNAMTAVPRSASEQQGQSWSLNLLQADGIGGTYRDGEIVPHVPPDDTVPDGMDPPPAPSGLFPV